MALFIKHRFSKRCIAFLVVFPLLIVTSLVNVECPVCQGTGSVSYPLGMEKVKIISVYSECLPLSEDMRLMGEMNVEMHQFDALVMVPFHVELSVVNNGADEVKGYIKLTLVYHAGNTITTENPQYVTLDIHGGATLGLIYDIPYGVKSAWFQSTETEDLLRQQTSIDAELVINDAPDVICNGTGKIPLSSWLLVNAFKGRLLEIGGEGVEYKPEMVFE